MLKICHKAALVMMAGVGRGGQEIYVLLCKFIQKRSILYNSDASGMSSLCGTKSLSSKYFNIQQKLSLRVFRFPDILMKQEKL